MFSLKKTLKTHPNFTFYAHFVLPSKLNLMRIQVVLQYFSFHRWTKQTKYGKKAPPTGFEKNILPLFYKNNAKKNVHNESKNIFSYIKSCCWSIFALKSQKHDGRITLRRYFDCQIRYSHEITDFVKLVKIKKITEYSMIF